MKKALFLLLFCTFAFGVSENEPNDQCSQANNIAVNSSAQGELYKTITYSLLPPNVSIEEDNDYWSFTAPSNGEIHLHTTDSSEDIDGYIYSTCSLFHFFSDVKDTTDYENIDMFFPVQANKQYQTELTIASSGSTDYTLHIDFYPQENIVYNANDLCEIGRWEKPDGLGICANFFGFSFGFNCANVVQIKHQSSEELRNLNLYYYSTGLRGNFWSSCTGEPEGFCSASGFISFGPFGFFSQTFRYTLDNPLTASDTNVTISNKHFMDMGFFENNSYPLYAIYEKNGKLHKGIVYPCSAKSQGKFNIVSKPHTQYDANSSSPTNALFTQIARKEFNITAVHLENDQKTPKPTKQVLFLDLIDASSLNGFLTSCASAKTLKSFHEALDFNGQAHITKTITVDQSIEQASFRIKYIDWDKIINNINKSIDDNDLKLTCNAETLSTKFKGVPTCAADKLALIFPNTHCVDPGEPCDPNGNGQGPYPYNHEYGCLECLVDTYHENLCAWDNFSVRPDGYDLELNESYLVGKQLYHLDINATKQDGSLDTNYTTTLSNTNTFSTHLKSKPGCKGSQEANITYHLANQSLHFNQGKASFDSYTFNDVGDVELNLTDSQWTAVDQNKKAPGGSIYSDCIPNSATNIPDAEGKVGCLIQATKPLTFHPKKFEHNLSLANFKNGGFTYFSSNPAMHATLKLTTHALLADGNRAQNYSGGCYAKDINVSLQILKPFASDAIPFANPSEYELMSSSFPAKIKIQESNFSLGEVNTSLLFVIKKSSTPRPPLFVHKNDFNLSSIESSFAIKGVRGADFDRSTDHTILFVDGRLHAPAYKSSTSSYPFKVYFEFYDPNSQVPSTIRGKESEDEIHWYRNLAHIDKTFGQVEIWHKEHNLSQGEDAWLRLTPQGEIDHGMRKFILTYKKNFFPYTARLELKGSSWLTPSMMEILFEKSGVWKGVAHPKPQQEVAPSTLPYNRIEW